MKDLERCFEAGVTVSAKELLEKRLISTLQKPVKILGEGELSRGLTVKADAFSASAKSKIEAAGGKTEVN